MTDTPRDVFLKLVHGVCEERWADVVDLYAERTDVRHPFFPLEAPPMRSREELRTHFGGGPQPYQGPTLRRRPTRINVHQTTDPEVIVAEFQYEGVVVETGEPFAIPAVFVMRVRDGKIVESRDYLDHLRSAAARGQLPEVLDAIRDHHAKDRVTDPAGHNRGDAGMTAERSMPTQDDVLRYFDTLSNWGRWGDDDELGTLNHITDDVRLAAARAVRHGRSVSCAWEVAVPEEMERSTTSCPCFADMPGVENMPLPGFRNDRHWGYSNERLGILFHGNTITHVDSPCHIFWDGTMYNGRPHSLVDTETGSAWGAVTAAANGIVTRGVLLDIAKVRDVPWLEPGEGVFPEDLEEAERRQGVRVRSGDAVLLRTGYGRVRHESGASGGFTQAGWHASCLPWLHERGVALIGADTPQDVQPSGYEDMAMPVHTVGLVAMGLWLLDNCDLEACAATAAELGQWDFHLAVAPVRFAGTSGSPVNPIATF